MSDAVIEGNDIVIRVAIDALPAVVESGPFVGWRVTDGAAFARDLVHELNAESEDGTTVVHLMFDRAIERAIENGAQGVEENKEQW